MSLLCGLGTAPGTAGKNGDPADVRCLAVTPRGSQPLTAGIAARHPVLLPASRLMAPTAVSCRQEMRKRVPAKTTRRCDGLMWHWGTAVLRGGGDQARALAQPHFFVAPFGFFSAGDIRSRQQFLMR